MDTPQHKEFTTPIHDDVQRVSVFIAAKQDFAVEGLVRILADDARNHVVACVEPGKPGCWDKLRAARPQIVLIHHHSIQIPKRELFTRIFSMAPGSRILVFGQGMDDEYLMDSVRSGASGYLNESMQGDDLLLAVRSVSKGHLWLEPRLMEYFARNAIEFEHTLEQAIMERLDSVQKILTKQERIVFEMVLAGLSTRDIADRTHRSEQSVKMHLGRMFKKFNVPSRAQLIVEIYARICPVQNMVRLIRNAFGIKQGTDEHTI
jgi:DNA-binding NarL/FixJ family response regulator